MFYYCTEYTIRDKVVERTYKTIAFFVVIHQGLVEKKTVNKEELLWLVSFGVEMVFSSKDNIIMNEDDDRTQEVTCELGANMKKLTDVAIKFKMERNKNLDSWVKKIEMQLASCIKT